MQDQQGIIYCYYPSLGSNFFPKYNSILTLGADKTSQGRPGGCGSKVSTRQTVSLNDLTLGRVLGRREGLADGGTVWEAGHSGQLPAPGLLLVFVRAVAGQQSQGAARKGGQGLGELPFPAASWALDLLPKSTCASSSRYSLQSLPTAGFPGFWRTPSLQTPVSPQSHHAHWGPAWLTVFLQRSQPQPTVRWRHSEPRTGGPPKPPTGQESAWQERGHRSECFHVRKC